MSYEGGEEVVGQGGWSVLRGVRLRERVGVGGVGEEGE